MALVFCTWRTPSQSAGGWKDLPVQTNTVPLVLLFPMVGWMGPTCHPRRSKCPRWEHHPSPFLPCFFSWSDALRTLSVGQSVSGLVCVGRGVQHPRLCPQRASDGPESQRYRVTPPGSPLGASTRTLPAHVPFLLLSPRSSPDPQRKTMWNGKGDQRREARREGRAGSRRSPGGPANRS